MFTLSSADLNIPHKSDQERKKPIRFQSPNEKFPKERITHDTVASCDEDGHIFVYGPNQNHTTEELSGKSNIFLLKLINLSCFFFSSITKKN
jgi:hypothetical protein